MGNNDSGNTSETMSLGTTPTTSQTTSTSQLLDSGKSDLENLKPRSPDPVPAARRKPVMLLVEDNPVNMMLLATYMKKNKWEFEKASNGLIAMEAFRKKPNAASPTNTKTSSKQPPHQHTYPTPPITQPACSPPPSHSTSRPRHLHHHTYHLDPIQSRPPIPQPQTKIQPSPFQHHLKMD